MTTKVRFGALLWMARTTWDDVLLAALTAERAGFDDLWVSDHLLPDTGTADDPVFDGPSILAGLAASTHQIGLGTLVSPISLRHPALIAKAAVTIDHISGGRFTLGLGAGWFESEHTAHDIPFGNTGERFDRLEAAVPLIRSLVDGHWTNRSASPFAITSHQSPARLGSLQILIGGTGERRTLPIVANYADIWHANGRLEELVRLSGRVDGLLAAGGRSPQSLARATNRWVAVRKSTSEAVEAIQRTLDYQHAGEAPKWRLSAGSVDVVARDLMPFVNAGFGSLILSFRAPFDYTTIERLPEIRAALAVNLAA